MFSGRLFQTWGPATGKVRLPIVESLNGGTTRQLVLAERRLCRSSDGFHDGTIMASHCWNGLVLEDGPMLGRFCWASDGKPSLIHRWIASIVLMPGYSYTTSSFTNTRLLELQYLNFFCSRMFVFCVHVDNDHCGYFDVNANTRSLGFSFVYILQFHNNNNATNFRSQAI